jgi:hypothetical protein
MSRESPDAEDLIAHARIEVTKHREHGDYSPELLRGLAAEFKPPEEGFDSAPEALAYIPSARPLRAEKPWGAPGVTVKRVIRRLLAWYVHPITVDQSRFNSAVVRELRKLERHVEDLESSRRDTQPDSTDRP